MNEPIISDKTFLGLIFTADEDGPGFQVSYGVEGCQDLRRNALYTWMKGAIEDRWINITVVRLVTMEYLTCK